MDTDKLTTYKKLYGDIVYAEHILQKVVSLLKSAHWLAEDLLLSSCPQTNPNKEDRP